MEFRRPTPLPRLHAGAIFARVRHHRRTRLLVTGLLVAAAWWAIQAEHRRAENAAAAWGPATIVWVAATDLDAGHLLASPDLIERTLPPGALPADVVTEPPLGQRLVDAVGQGEILREARVDGVGSSANGSVVGDGRGAVRLSLPTPHLQPGDHVDLYGLVTGSIVASRAEVIAVVDEIAVVAVAEEVLGDLIRAFTSGDVVPVLVG